MRLLGFAAVSFCFLASTLTGQDNLQRRALLIGVSEYEKAGFSSLKYPEADVKGIEAELKRAGFKTTLMLSSFDKNNSLRSTKSNIDHQLLSPAEFRDRKLKNGKLKPGFVAGLGDLNKIDLVMVVLAGHGRQELTSNQETARKEAVPYFCPTDANRSDSETWVSINRLMKNVSESSGSEKNLILIDACRDNPSRGRGIDGKSVSINVDNLAICFSSSAGTESYESDKLKHGIFSHFVIEGLKGKAANFRKQVTWNSLTGYVQTMVSEQAPILIDRQQSPLVAGSLKAAPVLIPKISSGARTYTSSTTQMEFVRIEPGTFTMGSDRAYEKPAHLVTLSEPFYFGKSEVTQDQWKTIMGTQPWNAKKWVKEGNNYPATYVSWHDCVEYCKKLSSKDGRQYRLPSEAEWEYSCRAGNAELYSFGPSDAGLSDFAWYSDNTFEAGYKHPQPVRKKKPNRWGLYDTHGNVYEWCLDHDWNYDGKEPQTDPVKKLVGYGSDRNIFRGGAFHHSAGECSSSSRNFGPSAGRNSYVGFRVVCKIDE